MKELSLKKVSEPENFLYNLKFHLALTKLITDSEYKYAFRISYRKILLVKKQRGIK